MDIREHNRRAWDAEVEREAFEFSHTLTDLIGGQCEAGFLLTGLYEDRHRARPQAKYMPTYIATRAVKR